MKYAPSNFLKALMAIVVALLPMQADAKPEKGGKKRGARAGEVRKNAQKKAKRPSLRKAESRPKQKVNKAPSRKKQKISKPSSRPKVQNEVKRAKKRSSIAQQKQRPAVREKVRPNVERPAENRQANVPAKNRSKRENGHSQVNRQGKKREQNVVADRNGGSDKARPTRDRQERIAQMEDRRPAKIDSTEERQRRIARAEVREKASKDRKRKVVQRKERNRERVQNFRNNRHLRVAALRAQRQSLRATRAEARREYREEAREEIRDYWKDRADDIRDRIEDRRDDLFDDDWWERRHWRHRHVAVNNPWWWWQPARWSSVNIFLNAGWSEPVAYDYGTDVIYDDSAVYVRGEPVGTPVEYSREVITLANPPLDAIAEAPVVENEWTPLGVWALVQEDQGDAVMFFQLSVDQKGLISGAYVNVVSGEELPVSGQVDRTTQRAAWHIGDQTEKVFEAGMANLTQDQASCLVHLSPGEMQPWLLVRMEGPDLPNQPATVSSTPATSEP